MSDTGGVGGMAVRVAPHVAWSVEEKGVLLVNRRDGSVSLLRNPEAAIWDLVQRPRPRWQLVRLLTAITSQDEEAAETLLAGTLRRWREAGILEEEGDG
jgi:hypothetical protein